jgi:tetrahydromethanopterin S-methyltransferase subunit D
MGIGYVVTQGLKSVSKLVGADLSGWGAAISASIVTTTIYFLHALLSAVPAAAAPSVAIGLMLLVSVLGAFGIHATIKGFQPAKIVMK